MKKIIIIMISICANFYAQDSLKNYNLGEIVITSKQSSLVKSSSVIDINLDEIENADGINITDAVKHYPGLYVTTTSKNESKIYIRGYDQRQVAVFLDGVPIYDPYSGLVDLSNLPKNSFKKITVSKGMPSLAYGANSMGGTINFITKDRLNNSVSLNIESGSSHSTHLGVNGVLAGDLFYNINAGYSRSNGFIPAETKSDFKNENGGYRDNSDYENLGGMLKLGIHDVYNVDLAYSLMIVDNEKGVPTDVYTSRPRYWRYSEWKKSINNLMFNSVLSSIFSIKGNLYYESYKNVLDSYDDNTFSTQEMKYAFHSTYDDHSYGLNVLSDLEAFNFGLTRLSFSWRKDVHKEEGNYNEGFAGYEASILSSGVEQDIAFSNKFSGVFGIGYDLLTPIYANDNDLRNHSSSVNLFAGLNYEVSDALNFHLNTSRKNRFPTLKEFYSETIGRDLANPDLNIEKSINSEFGFNIRVGSNIDMNVNLFLSRINNLIHLVYLDEGLRQFQNVGKAEMDGAEIGFIYGLDNLKLNFGYTYLSAKNKTDNAVNEKLEYRPEHLISFMPNYRFDFKTEVQAEFFFTANKYGVNADTRELVKMEDYLLTNVKISHNIFENYYVYLRINNLTDIYYETEFGFPQPGREYFLGLKISY